MLFLRLDESHLTLFASQEDGKVVFPEGMETPIPFEHRKLRPYATFEMNLREIHASHTEFQKKQKVEVLVTSLATLVPISAFEEELCEDYYYFSVVGEKSPRPILRVFYDTLPTSNAVSIFALEEDVCQVIEAEFEEEIHYVSALTATLRNFADNIHPQHRRRVYIHCRGRHLDVIVYEGHQLLLLNTFEVNTARDVTYYSLNVARSLGLDLAQTPFTSCGNETECEAVVAELGRFVKNVGLLRNAAVFNRHPLAGLPDIPFDFVNHILTQ